jgi:hypothetical protein
VAAETKPLTKPTAEELKGVKLKPASKGEAAPKPQDDFRAALMKRRTAIHGEEEEEKPILNILKGGTKEPAPSVSSVTKAPGEIPQAPPLPPQTEGTAAKPLAVKPSQTPKPAEKPARPLGSSLEEQMRARGLIQ